MQRLCLKSRQDAEFEVVNIEDYKLRQVASAALIVDAKDETAKRFYQYFDFISLPETPNRLFLPMRTIERLFAE